MRNLATIQEVSTVEPIPEADKIECVSILGWKCVTRKGEFETGDKIVYIEIDSLLPFAPWSEFLFKGSEVKGADTKEFYRLRTVKLRGQVSQGLALPLSILAGKKFPTDKRDNPVYPFNVGMEVTAILGIVKYEPTIPAQLGGLVKGSFPSFIPRTDETRIQSAPDVLAEIAGKEIYITTKMDGCSGTFYVNKGEFGACNRSMEFKPECDNTFMKLANRYGLAEKMAALNRNIAIQGEVCGPSIQKNRLNLKDHELYVFNVYDIDAGKYLNVHDAWNICEQLGVKTVPIEHSETAPIWTIEKLLEKAKGQYPGTQNQKEGIVIRPILECESVALKGRLSFKVVNNEYLLKGGE